MSSFKRQVKQNSLLQIVLQKSAKLHEIQNMTCMMEKKLTQISQYLYKSVYVAPENDGKPQIICAK